MALKHTSILDMYASTPLLHRPRFSSGVNQFGLKPETPYDFVNPTNLINFGAGTTVDTLDVRRAAIGRGSSPSFRSVAITDNAVRALGVVPGDPNAISFCSRESASLRICMARGQSTCEQEHQRLETCLGRVTPLKEEIQKVGRGFADWFIQNVSDNFTKPYAHRPQDNKAHYYQEYLDKSRRMSGKATYQFPKRLAWGARTFHLPGTARYSRQPVNK